MKTKIVATVGPSLGNAETLGKAIRAGARIFRLNFSHGTHESHRAAVEAIREAEEREGIPVAVLQDLAGPKIRVGKLPAPLEVKPGDTVVIKRAGEEGPGELPVTYPYIVEDLEPGERIFIEDGKIALEVISRGRDHVKARVISGGVIRPEKGVNLPDSSLRIAPFTEKDRRDLEFGLTLDIDLVALSFVRNGDDARDLKAVAGEIPVIAKVERREAVKNLSSVVEAFDGIMVARGDLGVELPLEEVPILQKRMIAMANSRRKTVITATQMLSTMIKNPYPTRAEVSDVANAVFDGSDALMLSGETAIGDYPIEAISTMARVIEEVEASSEFWAVRKLLDRGPSDPTEALAESAVITAEKIGASAIIVFTASGSTALKVSKFRPRVPVFAITPREEIRRRMAITWGVESFPLPFLQNTDLMMERGVNLLRSRGKLKPGQRVVITAGKTPLKGATDMVKVFRVGG